MTNLRKLIYAGNLEEKEAMLVKNQIINFPWPYFSFYLHFLFFYIYYSLMVIGKYIESIKKTSEDGKIMSQTLLTIEHFALIYIK